MSEQGKSGECPSGIHDYGGTWGVGEAFARRHGCVCHKARLEYVSRARVDREDGNWIEVYSEPCEWCLVWVGPHRHRLKDNETIGNVVMAIPGLTDPADSET